MVNITLELLGDFADKFAKKCMDLFARKTDIPAKYEHPTSSGNKHIPAGGKTGQILRWTADGTAAWGDDSDTTYSSMSGASDSAAGKGGLVPAPAAGEQDAFLCGDGTWREITEATGADIDDIVNNAFKG
ncbi:MAG: hypothetical protein NC331_11285 [Lachnospiraceae bacterium]|nr:hypothetical protein [Lachnospiraceae bacterium]MCM1239950.1 hypothetical protein [Lachnospiraceae bacterium]